MVEVLSWNFILFTVKLVGVWNLGTLRFSGSQVPVLSPVTDNWWNNMRLDVRKPVFALSDQVRHKPGCTATEDG